MEFSKRVQNLISCGAFREDSLHGGMPKANTQEDEVLKIVKNWQETCRNKEYVSKTMYELLRERFGSQKELLLEISKYNRYWTHFHFILQVLVHLRSRMKIDALDKGLGSYYSPYKRETSKKWFKA